MNLKIIITLLIEIINFTLNSCLIYNLIILMCTKYAEITNSGCMCIGVKDSKLNDCIANLRRDITWINRKWKKKGLKCYKIIQRL